jgi:DNA (cytosine-5)-methyltransferase 1
MIDNVSRRLLDLFCGAGGCAVGYHRAGFTDITGVDIAPQPRYPFDFVQTDALDYLRSIIESGEVEQYDLIHASPPCQAYSVTNSLTKRDHPELIESIRELLKATGKPYVIENVSGAPLINPVLLIGTMFGLKTVRRRLFECSFDVPFRLAPPPPTQRKLGRAIQEGDFIQVVGNFSGAEYARRAMGIDWMTRTELAQAIPPTYTEWIGQQMQAAGYSRRREVGR